jgi:hypothetical protein
MRKLLGVMAATLGVIVVAIPSAAPASAAVAGYLPFGGYDRGGYEYS